jgi:hypothetical protein
MVPSAGNVSSGVSAPVPGRLTRVPEGSTFNTRLQEIVRRTGETRGDDPLPFLDETSELKFRLAQAKSAQFRAEQQARDAQYLCAQVKESNPVNLPAIAANDRRYQELKKEYENVLLDTSLSASTRQPKIDPVIEKLNLWVKAIYLPELEASVASARNLLVRCHSEVEEAELNLKAHQAKIEKERQSRDAKIQDERAARDRARTERTRQELP